MFDSKAPVRRLMGSMLARDGLVDFDGLVCAPVPEEGLCYSHEAEF